MAANSPWENPKPPELPQREINPPPLGNTQMEIPTELLQADWIRLHRKRTNWGVGLGIVLPFAGNIFLVFLAGAIGAALSPPGPGNHHGSPLPLLVGIIFFYPILFYSMALFIWGCQGYAMSKGLPAAWGYLGFLSLFGLVILLLLPRRSPVIAPWRGYFHLPLFRIPVARDLHTD